MQAQQRTLTPIASFAQRIHLKASRWGTTVNRDEISNYIALREAQDENAPLVLKKPEMTEFGLPANFDKSAYDRQSHDKYSAEEKYKSRCRIVAFAIVIVLNYILIKSYMQDKFSHFEAMAFSAAILISPLVFIPVLLADIIIALTPKSMIYKGDTSLLIYSSANWEYRKAYALWEHHNAETGLAYWRAKRGVTFEHAVANLLRARGCKVQLTKATGDGGVDLIVELKGHIYWCQCKGHSKPISVAPVREIAGVCGKRSAIPVIIAVNGFTKPAQTTAEELGVTMLDAADLSRLAKMSAIMEMR